ncbi:porphobilinogen synthase [Candidatus Saganbacteria bacterium]|nr:porphobilinogen synthase [Candidatus Saganbacteria bacterium]
MLVMPYFVIHGEGKREPLASMPGHFRFSIDELLKELRETEQLGIKSILLFGIPRAKDPCGQEAYDDAGIVPAAIRAIKPAFPKMKIITDVCLCEYTSHGHCGILAGAKKVKINLVKTLELYARIAVANARAGADEVAPSGMMKKQVASIRRALDKNGFHNVTIMGYSAKYASAFYGPFREAAGSTPAFGDRTSYQMDPAATYQEALKEIAADIAEGADTVMVKPALAYLDVIREARRKFRKPLAVYNVSGEYSMLKAAAENGWIDGDKLLMEIMTAFCRAGADIIISYHAKDAARILHGK